MCGGVQLHVTDRDKFKPFFTSIALLYTVKKLYPDDFSWRTETYEFVSDRLAIDLLYGNPALREGVESSTLSLTDLEPVWKEETAEFLSQREACLIY